MSPDYRIVHLDLKSYKGKRVIFEPETHETRLKKGAGKKTVRRADLARLCLSHWSKAKRDCIDIWDFEKMATSIPQGQAHSFIISSTWLQKLPPPTRR